MPRLFGNCVAVSRRRCRGYLVIRQLRCGYSVIWQLRCGYTVNLAALPRLFGITLAVMRLFAAVIGGVGIQPERLNAEGEARELLAEGGALA